jgi:hypothetical protein
MTKLIGSHIGFNSDSVNHHVQALALDTVPTSAHGAIWRLLANQFQGHGERIGAALALFTNLYISTTPLT